MADAYFVTRQTKRTGQGQTSIIRICTFGTNHTRKKKKKKKDSRDGEGKLAGWVRKRMGREKKKRIHSTRCHSEGMSRTTRKSSLFATTLNWLQATDVPRLLQCMMHLPRRKRNYYCRLLYYVLTIKLSRAGGDLYSKRWRRGGGGGVCVCCLLYTSPSPRDRLVSRMPSSA